MNGLVGLPRIGAVVAGPGQSPPYVLVDQHGAPVEPAVQYLQDLALSDASPLTCKSYGYDLLRWFRMLWLLNIEWNRATEAEVSLMVGWLRSASNPQRHRRRPGAAAAGTVNARTGKQTLKKGYAPRTINHCLSVIWSLYAYHAHFGCGPVINPVPESSERRQALAHLNPLAPKPIVRRARLRQRVPKAQPRSIPDNLWDELFDAMRNDRDRALLMFYVSSAARASELLGVGMDDVDWGGLRVWVISKGSRAREDIPADPKAFSYLAADLEQAGLPEPGQPMFRTLRGESRPLTYSALRTNETHSSSTPSTNIPSYRMASVVNCEIDCDAGGPLTRQARAAGPAPHHCHAPRQLASALRHGVNLVGARWRGPPVGWQAQIDGDVVALAPRRAALELTISGEPFNVTFEHTADAAPAQGADDYER